MAEIELHHQKMIKKTQKSNLGEIPVSKIMHTNNIVNVMPHYTIKSTIETFRVRHISGAPVINDQGKLIGMISEFDLLIQAASKDLNDQIEYNSKITAVGPDTTLKELLIILYKNRLKRIPVINQDNLLIGIISRIDILAFIADNER